MTDNSHHERDPLSDHAPCGAEEALRRLELNLSDEIGLVEATEPGPIASLDAILTHGLRANRLRADGDYLDGVRARLKALQNITDSPLTEQ